MNGTNSQIDKLCSPNAPVPDHVLAAMARYFPAGIVAVRADDSIGFMNSFATQQIFGDSLRPGDSFADLLEMCGEPQLLGSGTESGLSSLLVCIERSRTSAHYILSTVPLGRDETVLMFQPAFPLIQTAPTQAPADEEVINRLVGQVSHHVSNPLSYIVMNLEFLKETMSNLDLQPEQSASRDECEDLMSTMSTGVSRITEVLRALQAVNLGQLEPKECLEQLEDKERRGHAS